jgi:LCP family protein required for cell wall assembly
MSVDEATIKEDEPELVELRSKKGKAKAPRSRKKRIALWASLGVVFVLFAGVGFLVFLVSQDLGQSFQGGILGLLRRDSLRTDEHGRTNALIFALGGYEPDGSDHDGGSGILTDSIMVISVDQETGDRFTLSIPRDLFVRHTCGQGRINEVYACLIRRGRSEVEAAEALVDKVTEVTGIEIQYFARINFTVVHELVDRVGGVEVTIPHAMADNGCGFNFRAGQVVHMDGEAAICFSQARNFNGGFGIPNDFERGMNQQRVLRALQKAAIEDGKLLSPVAAIGALDSLGNHLRTNLQTSEIRTALDLFVAASADKDRGEYAFVDRVRGVFLLRDEVTSGGAMVLVPSGTTDWFDYRQIHEHIQKVMRGEA